MNSLKNLFLRVAPICSAFLLVGCATNFTGSDDGNYESSLMADSFSETFEEEGPIGFTTDKSREEVLATRSLQHLMDENYQVGPDDVLEISIFEWQAEGARDTLDLRVSKAGEIAMPGLGAIQVGGMSVEEIQQYLVNELQEAGIIEVNPRVGVSIKEFRSKRVSIVGSVVAPGVYALTENVASLMEIISLAGGQAGGAGNVAYVLRTSENRDNPAQIEIDLDELFRGGTSDLNAILSDGDTVYVPKSAQIRLYGEVNNPGSVVIDKNLTLIEAISEAGGLTEEADKSLVRIDRKVGPGKTRGISLNLAAIEAGQRSDIMLQEGDIVHIPVNESKKAIKKAFDSFSRIFSAGYRIN